MKIRTSSPTEAANGVVLYRFAWPLKTTKSGGLLSILAYSPPEPENSLWTRRYSRAVGRPPFGSTITAPYIPSAMCIRTGAAPQWYMKTPG